MAIKILNKMVKKLRHCFKVKYLMKTCKERMHMITYDVESVGNWFLNIRFQVINKEHKT